MPTAPGRKSYISGPRRFISYSVTPETEDAIEYVGNTLRISMASTQVLCVTKGFEPLFAALSIAPFELPVNLRDLGEVEATLPGLDKSPTEPTVVRYSQRTRTGRTSPVQRVGLTADQATIVTDVAHQLGMRVTALCAWAMVSYLNVLLDGLGVEQVSLLPAVEKQIPAQLLAAGRDGIPVLEKSTLVPLERTAPTGKKSRRASAPEEEALLAS